MKPLTLVATAIANTFRSKLRTTLTVLAIFIGAFTLTITNGLGIGINRYIDDTVAAIGANDVMTVTKPVDQNASGPQEYRPDVTTVQGRAQPGNPNGATLESLTPTDLSAIEEITGVKSVEPARTIKTDFIQYADGKQYQLSVGNLIPGIRIQTSAGEAPSSASSDNEIAIPTEFVKPLGFSSDEDAIGKTVLIGITDRQGLQSEIEATVVGVSEATLTGSSSATLNEALEQNLFDRQQVGIAAAQKDSYASAIVRFDPQSSDAQISQLKSDLTKSGFEGLTTNDQIGSFRSVIDAIVLVLNAFAIIALLAASFGIVNTLLMSVQERTREIGLMKAMGMGSGKVFGMFSLEAVFIGFLGSAVGAGLAVLAGLGISTQLSNTLFSDLPGLTIIAFDAPSILSVFALVMGIAFLAGTLPAYRAARKTPIEALRYE